MRPPNVKRPVLILSIAIGILFAGNVAVIAGHQFSDVPDGSTGTYQEAIHDGVDWIVNRAITAGCGSGKYCPDDPVLRRDMAIFMQRLGVALTPTFVTASSQFAGVSAGTEVCVTSSFTPSFPSTAGIQATVGVEPTAAGAGWLRTAYSVDGGSSWTDTSSRFSGEQYTEPGKRGSVTYADTLDLQAGTSYMFAVEINGITTAATDNYCQLIATVYNRNP